MWLSEARTEAPPCYLEGAVITACNAGIESRRPLSSALQSANCFSLSAVAWTKGVLQPTTSLSGCLMSVFGRAPIAGTAALVLQSLSPASLSVVLAETSLCWPAPSVRKFALGPQRVLGQLRASEV